MDEYTIEKNDNADFFVMNSTLKDAGTLDATLDMYVNVLEELPQNMEISLKIDRRNDKGEYVPTPVKIKQNYCDFLRTDKIIMPFLLKHGNFYSKCPIGPNVYYVKDATFRGYQLPLALPLGSYRGTFVYLIAKKETTVVWKGKFVKS